METGSICARLAAWLTQYPVPVAPGEQNATARDAEDRFLARFAGLDRLGRSEVTALVKWKFQAMPYRKTLTLRGVTLDRWNGQDGIPGAADLIRKGLATGGDYQALASIPPGVSGEV